MIDRPLVAYGVISLILGVFVFNVIGPLSVLLLLFGPVFIALGLFAKAPEKPREEEPTPVEQPSKEQSLAPATREVYRETIIREIVKIRCRHCGTLFEEKLDHCPHCGAPP